MLNIEKKEMSDIFVTACEISQTLESKQYLSRYEDKEKYNAYMMNEDVRWMVQSRAQSDGYVLADADAQNEGVIYMFSSTLNSIYGLTYYEMKSRIIEKNDKNPVLKEKLMMIVLVQYFAMVEAKQDKFMYDTSVYLVDDFINQIDATFKNIEAVNQGDEDLYDLMVNYGNVIEVARYWDKMGNVIEKNNNGYVSKEAFVDKIFRKLLVGKNKNEHISLIDYDGTSFRPTKRALAFVSNSDASALQEIIKTIENLRTKSIKEDEK